MLKSRNQLMHETLIENLMCAHRRLSFNGSAMHLIVLTWYLLRLIKKQEDCLIDFVPQEN